MSFSPLRRWILPLAGLCVLVALARGAAAQHPLLPGYAKYTEFTAQIAELDKSDLVAVRSLAKTAGDRDVFLLTVGSGEPDAKPAILIVGSTEPQSLVGSEVAVRLVGEIVKRANEPAIKELLSRVTLYVIPRPSPDANEKCFAKPYREPRGNGRATNDDRDAQAGEDPPEDLNGDGLITMMRVADDTGNWAPHPDDPRVLIQIDPKKNERGQFRVYVEGVDNDRDEQWNEDAGDGVSFARNFPWSYPAFTSFAGPNAVSEPETRAVADFAYDHPSIVAVLSFSGDDNLFHVWKPDGAAEGNRIKKRVLGADAEYFEQIATRYKKIHGGSDPPGAAEADGAFVPWAYFHFGRFAFAARPWWIPKTAAEEMKPAEGAKPGEKKPSGESRAADDLNALRWLAKEKIDGFVEWTAVKHPDFGDRKVEVGGFKPFVRTHPPVAELTKLATAQANFVADLVTLLPKLELRDVKVEPLGGIYRIRATAVNAGYLPTMPEMGRMSQQAYPVRWTLTLPEGTQFVQGTPRGTLPPIAGNGGKRELVWLVRPTSSDKPIAGKLNLFAPAVGTAEANLELKP